MPYHQLQLKRLASAIAIGLLSPILILPAQDASSSSPAPRRSSIILIVADGIGCGDIGCYGSTKASTPNLDKLAADGARFTSFYAGSTVNSASRASLMLGLHTGHLKIRDDSPGATLGENDLTFSQLLRQSGYRTALIGTWGLSDGASGLPQNKGFEQFAGFLNRSEGQTDYPEFIHRYEPANAVDKTFDGRLQLSRNAEGKRGQHIMDVCTEAAMNFVRIAKPESYSNYRPFFLMLAYPPSKAANMSQTDRDTMISRIDVSVGQLLNKLKEMNTETNTIVIFTSSRTPQKEGNGKLSEADIRVPLIVRWPARLKPVTISEPWAAWDVFPTMTDIARTNCPTNINGISFYPTLLSQKQIKHHDFFYWEIHNAQHGLKQAARMGDWKAVRPLVDAPLELYDLESDADEKKNVANEHSDVITKFETYLKTVRNGAGVAPLQKSKP